jgi:glycosyltransferase involved in cell wall biosynthesis
LAPLLFRVINRKTKKIIVHSLHAKKLLISNFPFISGKKIVIIPYGTYLNSAIKSEIHSIRKEKHLSDKDIIFLYVGFIKHSKGILETIEAFKSLTSKKIKLYLIGKCIDQDLLIYFKKIEDSRIIYLGSLNNTQLHSWLSTADVIINFRKDSVGETSSSVMNALNFGKPILGSNIGSNPEILGRSGLLSDFKISEIRNAMEIFASNKKVRLYLTNEAIQRRNELQWKKLRPKYINLFTNSIL